MTDAELIARAAEIKKLVDAFVEQVEQHPALYVPLRTAYESPTPVDQDDGGIGTLSRALSYLSCGAEDLSVLKAAMKGKTDIDEPDCGGDPRCLTHQGGSHNMTSTKECRRER